MRCQVCGTSGRTVNARFLSAIGMLFVSRFFSTKGGMCKSCMQKQFLEYTLTTLALGWWSMPSLLASPLILIYNVASFIVARVKLRPSAVQVSVSESTAVLA
jgi:ABC-type dipeptide/oligopeptide/nickel transport system permease component